MIRAILGVIIGYVAIVVIVFGTYTVSYLLLGVDRTFQPGTYQVTGLWLAVSLTLSFLAAIVAGKVARVVGGGLLAVMGLAVVVLVLGMVSAIPALLSAGSAPAPRPGDASNITAMMNAKEPLSVALALPVIGIVGVLIGGKKKK